MIAAFGHSIILLSLIYVAKGTVSFHLDHALADMTIILDAMTTSDGIEFPHCTLTKEFLSTANSVYNCQKVIEQNPICNRSLVVAYSQLEPLVYKNETGHVVGILPGKFMNNFELILAIKNNNSNKFWPK